MRSEPFKRMRLAHAQTGGMPAPGGLMKSEAPLPSSADHELLLAQPFAAVDGAEDVSTLDGEDEGGLEMSTGDGGLAGWRGAYDIHGPATMVHSVGAVRGGKPDRGTGGTKRARTDEAITTAPGTVFLRVQTQDTPGSLLTFEDNESPPLWFEDLGDCVQMVTDAPECDITDLTLECVCRLDDDGMTLVPATLGEMAAYFSMALSDQRAPADVPDRVMIAIQCDRSRGWFTYKHEVGSPFTAVMVCRDDLANGSVRFSEMSPAQFEIQRAQCAQKKWRQSFKVIGAHKLAKGNTLSQACIGDILKFLERVLGVSKSTGKQEAPAPPPLPPRAPAVRVVTANANAGRSMDAHMAAMSNGTDSMLPGHMPPMGMMGGSTGAMPGQGQGVVRRASTVHSGLNPGGGRFNPGGAGGGMMGPGGMHGGGLGAAGLQRPPSGPAPGVGGSLTGLPALDMLAQVAMNGNGSAALASPLGGGANGNGSGSTLANLLSHGRNLQQLLANSDVVQLLLMEQQALQQQRTAQLQQLQLSLLLARQVHDEQTNVGALLAAHAAGLATGAGAGAAAGAGDGAAEVPRRSSPAAAGGPDIKAEETPAGAAAAGGRSPVGTPAALGAASAVADVAASLLEPGTGGRVGAAALIGGPHLPRATADAIRTIVGSVQGPDLAHAVKGILEHLDEKHGTDSAASFGLSVLGQKTSGTGTLTAVQAALKEAIARAQGGGGQTPAAGRGGGAGPSRLGQAAAVGAGGEEEGLPLDVVPGGQGVLEAGAEEEQYIASHRVTEDGVALVGEGDAEMVDGVVIEDGAV